MAAAGSKLPVGSSARMSAGLWMIARARGHPLLFAARERGGAVVHARTQADGLQELGGAAARKGEARAVQAQRHEEVL